MKRTLRASDWEVPMGAARATESIELRTRRVVGAFIVVV